MIAHTLKDMAQRRKKVNMTLMETTLIPISTKKYFCFDPIFEHGVEE